MRVETNHRLDAPLRSEFQPEVTCVVCGSVGCVPFAQLPQVPTHTTMLLARREEALAAAKADIVLSYCRTCGHIFNSQFDPARAQYEEGYDSSLHFSPTFQAYAEELADQLIERHDIKGKRIVEIGSGAGDFLALLCERGGNTGLGFDPSYVPGPAHAHLVNAGRMRFIADFYSPRYADHPADVIICRQALEHIQFPHAFLRDLRDTVGSRPTTILFFEVPDVRLLLSDQDIWTLIYEHCSYFSSGSLRTLFRRSGFVVMALEGVFGDQFLGITVQPGQQVRAFDDQHDLAEQVSQFRDTMETVVTRWQQTLEAREREGKKVVVWGGGARGTTFLNIADPRRTIEYVVDINPRKEDTYIAGTGQKIVRETFLASYRPDAIIIMNPIYRDEIASALAAMGVQAELLIA